MGRQIELGLGWLRTVAQVCIYSCTTIKLGSNVQHNLNSWCKIGLGLGWLRAVAQGCIYSYNKIWSASNF